MPARPHVAAVFLLALGGILSELAWTRLVGLFFYGEVAFLVITLAVAGSSLGAALAVARRGWRERYAHTALLAGLTLAAGTASALSLAGRGGLGASLASVLPAFLFLGMTFAGLFARYASHAPRLYAADLIGAAMGALLALPLFATVGAPAASLLAAGSTLTAAILLLRGEPAGRSVAIVVLIGILAATLPGASRSLLERPAYAWSTDKSLSLEIARGGLLEGSAWGTMGRSDLVTRADGSVVLYLDGSAGSLLPTDGADASWRLDPGRLPFEALRPDRVFIVGAGAGVEVAHALETGASTVHAADVNAAGVRLAERAWADLRPVDGVEPFTDPRVTWRFDEARSVLAATDSQWDLISVAQAVTRTAEARGLALTENGVYTAEAFANMLTHLAPDGVLALEMYDEATLTRALFTAAASLQEEGLAGSDAEALDHMIAVLDRATSPPTPLLLVHRSAPSEGRILTIARAAESRGMALLHLPNLLENPPLDAVASGEASFAALAAAADGVDLTPTSDDRPFFWSFEPGVPRALLRAMLVVVVTAAVLVGALLFVDRSATLRGQRGLLFASLVVGFAFLSLQLTILSKVSILVGHPAAALATTLAGLLLGMGLGSASALTWPNSFQSVRRSALIAAFVICAWMAAWAWISPSLAASSLTVRTLTALTTLLPLGMALGLAFPLLLRHLGTGRGGGSNAARAWALNGIGSLLAGVGTLALAHVAGFDTVAWISMGMYILVALLTLTWSRVGST